MEFQYSTVNTMKTFFISDNDLSSIMAAIKRWKISTNLQNVVTEHLIEKSNIRNVENCTQVPFEQTEISANICSFKKE